MRFMRDEECAEPGHGRGDAHILGRERICNDPPPSVACLGAKHGAGSTHPLHGGLLVDNVVASSNDDDDIYYYTGERLKLEGETENMGV